MLKSFKPIINKDSKILILGSMPGIKSLEEAQYYAHPQNRFWKIMAVICNYPNLDKTDYSIKQKVLLENHIALWDVIKSCKREGSLDSNIQEEIPNDIEQLVKKYKNIKYIFCNGGKSYSSFKKYFKKIIEDKTFTVTALPSTSPANANYSFERLLNEWGRIKNSINF